MMLSSLKMWPIVRPVTRCFMNGRSIFTNMAASDKLVFRQCIAITSPYRPLMMCNKMIEPSSIASPPSTQLSSSKLWCQPYSSKPDLTNLSDSAWSCKLALENGYLSWCRNAYIAGVLAVGMLFKSQSEMMELACYTLFIIPLMNMTWGSLSYMYNLVVMRQRLGLSSVALSASLTWVIVKMALFWCAVIVFLSESDPRKVLPKLRGE